MAGQLVTPGLPAELEVAVTARHLALGRRGDRGRSPLTLAVRDALAEAGIPFTAAVAREHDVVIWRSHPTAHDARYWIPDDGWKLAARHAAGLRVKPCTVILPSVYRRKEPG